MKKIFLLLTVAALTFSACSDEYMESVNTDNTKTTSIDPNAQLTTCLLQTYGDFGLMDTYRSYITGFTQHFAGGWNVSNYGGSVHYNDDQARLIWDQYYSVAIKNLRDAIAHSADKPNINAVLRIHKVYLLSVLTDTYGDIPCRSTDTNLQETDPTPEYNTQEDCYKYFFEELKACLAQLGTGNDNVSGDVTNYNGELSYWKRYANSLRMRFAMRISDVATGDPTNPDVLNAQKEFEDAVNDPAGYIATYSQDAYIKYQNSPFTLYDGSRDFDFRANALGEILYGQDPTSPTFICTTLFNYLKDNNDPRLYCICRHYNNVRRSEIKPDKIGNVDLTDEFLGYIQAKDKKDNPSNPGAAWWNNWVNGPSDDEIAEYFPTLANLIKMYPDAGFNKNNFPARMMRPFLSVDFCQPNCPGVLFTSAEADFLIAEALTKGWSAPGTADEHFKSGIRAAMMFLNRHYLTAEDPITEGDINIYINNIMATNPLATAEGAREAINLQAWIHHMMNPAEAWANLRRADYPKTIDRSQLDKFTKDFTYDDDNLTTPLRLRYPIMEEKYNGASRQEAIDRMGGKDDWHHPLWWDKYPNKLQ
jgi:hypothetical protein